MYINKKQKLLSSIYGIVIILFISYTFYKIKTPNNTGTTDAAVDTSKFSLEGSSFSIETDDGKDVDLIEYYKNYDGELHYAPGFSPQYEYDPENKKVYSGIEYPFGRTNEELECQTLVSKYDQWDYGVSVEFTDQVLLSDRIKKIGEEFIPYDKMDHIRINDVKIYDNAEELDRSLFNTPESYSDFVDDKGDFKKLYYHSYLNGKPEVEKYMDSEQYDKAKPLMIRKEIKFIMVNVTLKSNHPWVETLRISNLFSIVKMKKDKKGLRRDFDDTGHYFSEKENGKLDYAHIAGNSLPEIAICYYDGAICTEKQKKADPNNFYINYIGKDESMTFNIGFFADVDEIDNLYIFHSVNMSPYIKEDSVCQYAVKLINEN